MWRQVEHLSTGEMCAAAKAMSVVLLDDQRTARLVWWPGDRTDRRPRGQRCRLEFPGGKRASIPMARVVAVHDESAAVTMTVPT